MENKQYGRINFIQKHMKHTRLAADLDNMKDYDSEVESSSSSSSSSSSGDSSSSSGSSSIEVTPTKEFSPVTRKTFK